MITPLNQRVFLGSRGGAHQVQIGAFFDGDAPFFQAFDFAGDKLVVFRSSIQFAYGPDGIVEFEQSLVRFRQAQDGAAAVFGILRGNHLGKGFDCLVKLLLNL